VPAQNALLKTLEDGPKYAVFLLLSENYKTFLPTVLSRCVLYKIPPLGDAEVLAYLKSQGVDRASAQAAVPYAGGYLGRAMTLVRDEEFMAFREEILTMARDMDSKDIVEIFAMAKALEGYKERVGQVLEIFIMYYRDALVSGHTANAMDAAKKIRIIEDIKQKLNQNSNFLLTMEVMLLKLSGVGIA